LEADAHNWDMGELPEPKLQDRLLTKKELDAIDFRNAESNFFDALWDTAKAQRDLTASYYQQKTKEIFEEIEKFVKWTEKHYALNLNFGTPESTGGIINLGEEYVLINKSQWQSLKEKEVGL